MNDDEAKPKPKTKVKKPGQWGIVDILLTLFAIAALIAIGIGGFRLAKWLVATYFKT